MSQGVCNTIRRVVTDCKVCAKFIKSVSRPIVTFLKANYFCQEPVLFDRSIAENIKYGDNSREVSMEEILKDIEVKH